MGDLSDLLGLKDSGGVQGLRSGELELTGPLGLDHGTAQVRSASTLPTRIRWKGSCHPQVVEERKLKDT